MKPITIEVTRGGSVESRHHVSLAVVDGAGRDVVAHGDVGTPVFPRSAVKVFQALPLIESGAADRFGLDARALSLCCASHSGEDGHVELAGTMLERAGLGEGDLECGCHWPFDQPVALSLARRGLQPTQLHNNCSGKHAGFLCTAVHLREDPKSYVGAEHPVQRRVRAAIADVTGLAEGDLPMGIDGCSIPTHAVPLRNLAQGFARLAGGEGVAPERARAGQRLMDACMAEPWLMSGTKRACLRLMEAAPGRVFAKTGAEGVFCGAVPELGLGFALKAEDGATRAAEAAVAATLARLWQGHDVELAERYDSLSRTHLRNWQGTEVGEVRAEWP
ncbi:asparaginase [Aureimonas ureilytica]|uniref:Asparaginase n=1 Tax=Aureimonas ureilytica TaxID=401562 RepID=A0A175RR16_9HYPH|nr:asparaginase [Aureimonas ureilytica]KTR05778.1 asparaginase [Aureimonas ureilytica]